MEWAEETLKGKKKNNKKTKRKSTMLITKALQ